MKVTGRTASLILVRIFVCCMGLGAVSWGIFLLPLFWRQVPLNRLASELLQGHTFSGRVLQDRARQLKMAEDSSFCTPAELHSAMILRLAILNEAIAAKDEKRIDAAYQPVYKIGAKGALMRAIGFLRMVDLILARCNQARDPAK